MTDEKKVHEGTIVPPDDPGMPATHGGADQRGFLTTGVQRIKKFGQLQEAKLDTKLETEKNNYGEQLVRKGEIHLSLGALQTKLENAPVIQEGVKAEVMAAAMEQQQRVHDLKNIKDEREIEREIRKAEQEGRLAKAKAGAQYWNNKLKGDAEPGPTLKEQIAALEAEKMKLIRQYTKAKEAAGDKLDEVIARQFDMDIGRIMRKIQDLHDDEDADDGGPPYDED
jgi:hypothetical protein